MSNVSEKQLAANRANALKSTGPISEEGKSVVRANAIKHGLSASAPSSVLMPDEDVDAFQELGLRLREAFKPVGDMEELLIERITACAWRLKRIERVEAGLFVHGFLAKQAQDMEQELERQSGLTDVLAMVRGEPVNDPKYRQTTRETTSDHQEMLATQQKATGAEAIGFLQDAQTNNGFSKLSRYEAGLERSFYKALDELKKLQRLRRNEENARGGRRVIRHR